MHGWTNIVDNERLPLPKRIGLRIKSHRKALDWSQEQLAVVLGIEIETVSRFERGATSPSLKLLEKIADIFSIGLADMFDNEKTVTKCSDIEKVASWFEPLGSADRALVLQTIKPICRRLQKCTSNEKT